jgi:hypothetical protein
MSEREKVEEIRLSILECSKVYYGKMDWVLRGVKWKFWNSSKRKSNPHNINLKSNTIKKPKLILSKVKF